MPTHYSKEAALRDGMLDSERVYESEPAAFKAFINAVSARKPASLKLVSAPEGKLIVRVLNFRPQVGAIRSYGYEPLNKRGEAEIWYTPEARHISAGGAEQWVLTSVPNQTTPTASGEVFKSIELTVIQYQTP